MLLKDLTFSMTSEALNMMALVIIKRNNEFYEIAIRTKLDKHALDRTQSEIDEFIKSFLHTAKQYYDKWQLLPDGELDKSTHKIHQVKIEL